MQTDNDEMGMNGYQRDDVASASDDEEESPDENWGYVMSKIIAEKLAIDVSSSDSLYSMSRQRIRLRMSGDHDRKNGSD